MALYFVCLLLFLVYGETRAFCPPVARRNLAKTIHCAERTKPEKPVGHLEPMLPPEDWESDSDCPGLQKGADSWPSPVSEPHVPPDRVGDTPRVGLGATSWPSPVQEPKIGFGSGPTDTPCLPKDPGIPPFTEEPRVP